jgi:hypothetical protein
MQGYRWLRARDGLYVEPAMERATCPVVKQLLGATSSSVGLFHPHSADCPLAYWLAKHQLGAPPGGLGRGHHQEARWCKDGLGVPDDPAICTRMADGDIGGHATYPRHPWRAACDVEPPAAPLVGGRSLIDRDVLATPDNPHVARTQTEAEIIAAVEMTPEQWLRNSITPEVQAKFEADGYVVIDTEETGTSVVSEADAAALRELMREQEGRTSFLLCAANENWRSAPALSLLSNPKVLTRVSGLLESTNICCHNARLIRGTDPEPADGGEGVAALQLQLHDHAPPLVQAIDGHLDRDLEMRPAPLISVTAMYALGEGGAAPTLAVLKGSHRLDTAPSDADIEAAGGLTAVRVPHRGCVIVDRRLWRTQTETAAALTSAQDVVEIGYGPRWLRPADPMHVEDVLAGAAVACPVLRQMLNWHSSCSGWWSPNVDDNPLQAWLNHHSVPPGVKGAGLAPAWAYGDGTKADDGHASVPRPAAMLPRPLDAPRM